MERFQSGQMGQTVNLLAMPSEVRILPSPPDDERISGPCGSNSGGRVTAFQAVGRGFESRLPLEIKIAHVAQSVEHFLGKEEVTGSSPVMSS